MRARTVYHASVIRPCDGNLHCQEEVETREAALRHVVELLKKQKPAADAPPPEPEAPKRKKRPARVIESDGWVTPLPVRALWLRGCCCCRRQQRFVRTSVSVSRVGSCRFVRRLRQQAVTRSAALRALRQVRAAFAWVAPCAAGLCPRQRDGRLSELRQQEEEYEESRRYDDGRRWANAWNASSLLFSDYDYMGVGASRLVCRMRRVHRVHQRGRCGCCLLVALIIIVRRARPWCT